MREHWDSRTIFLCAATGSAIGFSNIWRFPALLHEYGGGPFLIPYLLALMLIGIPMLILELSLGQAYKTGAAGALGKMNKRFRGLGLSSVFCAFIVSLYYSAILCWITRMFVYSVKGSNGRWREVTLEKAITWWENTITGLKTAGGMDRNFPTRVVPANLLGLSVVWAVVFLCLIFGLKLTGKIAVFTSILPMIMLVIVMVRSVTLKGSSTGISEYIGRWNMNVLSERPAVWSQAVAQVFFSLTVSLGVMSGIASYNTDSYDPTSSAGVIAGLSSIFSFLSGFAVFGILGHVAYLEGIKIADLSNLQGPGLIFATYPLGLSKLPGHGHWERLFFWALFFLGIHTLLFLVESITTVVKDTALFKKVTKRAVTFLVCGLAYISSLLFGTDTGLLWVDSIEFYISLAMIVIGIFETFAVGWIYGIEEQVAILGIFPLLSLFAAVYIPIIVACGLWFGLYSAWEGFLALILIFVALMLLVFFSLSRALKNREKYYSMKEAVVELFVGNLSSLRKELNGFAKQIPIAWFVLIKYFVPPGLIIFLANLISTNTTFGLYHPEKSVITYSSFGNYGNYPVGYQIVGIFIFSVSLFFILFGLLFPDALDCFNIVDENLLDIEMSKPERARSIDRTAELGLD